MDKISHQTDDHNGKPCLSLHNNKIAIIGHTNVGKSILFNKFAHSYSHVANYPQTTISIVRQNTTLDGKPFEIIDTPGISSLNVFSEDELLTRDILLKEHPELILFCGDATRLKLTLVLLAQVFELEIPVVFCLNMMDEAVKRGIVIDSAGLSEQTGSTVIETAATHGIGLKKLKNTIKTIRSCGIILKYPVVIEKAIEDLRALFPAENMPSKGLLLLFLMQEDGIAGLIESMYGAEILSKANEILYRILSTTSAERIRQTVFNVREAWAEEVAEEVSTKAAFTVTGIAQKAARASRHPVYGLPILLLILWATFYGVGTIATEIANALDSWIFVPSTAMISSLTAPYPMLNDFVVGDYGILTMGVFNAIGTVVPILIVFFMITGFLEDVGYLPNLSVLLNRFLSIFGLTGKAVLPLVLGFGCNTMATLTSRTLETKKERIVASFLIALGIPCAVQLGVLMAIMATAPFSVLLITLTAVLSTQIICGIALNKLMPTMHKSDFIMELPPFRLPNFRYIVMKTYHRVKWFLIEAVPLFVLSAAMMYALKITGLLTMIKSAFRPVVVGFLSLPGMVTEVFILVLARRELGAVYFKDMVEAGQVDYYQTITGLVVITLFIPCISNTMVMIKELGARWAVGLNIFIILIAILVGGAVNFLIRLW